MAELINYMDVQDSVEFIQACNLYFVGVDET